jgi:hypothetical protein
MMARCSFIQGESPGDNVIRVTKTFLLRIAIQVGTRTAASAFDKSSAESMSKPFVLSAQLPARLPSRGTQTSPAQIASLIAAELTRLQAITH